ncbi:MAG: ATP-binding protein [Rubrivivax sp.]|nr:ATP-binding protein [Rubrivivax sp.]
MLTWHASLAQAADGDAGGAASITLAVVAVLVLAATGAGAYLLGATRARLRTERALREARAEARQQTQLLEGRPWQTDAMHRPAGPPAGPPSGAGSPADALLAHPDVQARLRTRRAFTDLQVALAEPQQGSRVWLLRAVPRQDDLGAFCGYTGTARPDEEAAASRAGAAVLQALLELHNGAALLAVDQGAGWQLQRANEAARALWPQLDDGAALPAALRGLPGSVAAAFGAGAPAALRAEGWQVLPGLSGIALPGSARSLVLVQQLPAGAAEAAQAATTAESDSFSFTVSHDLRAPIRVVEGFTRIVKEDYGRLLDRVANDHLDRVLGAAARMNLMIDALLTLARLSTQPLTRQPVNLSQLAAYVVDELRRAAPEREAEVEIEPGLATNGDPTLLRLVLENLLGNAWKYSARCAKARISLLTVVHDGGLAYVVRDNGAGFDMRASERLFGLFQRLHSASEFPGTGVGLASVKRIVRRHGGDIWAEAEPGRGAAFYFTLAG